MASFEKRGTTWRYVFYATVDGKRKKIQKGSFKTKTEARKHASELEAYYNRGFSLDNTVVFHEYFQNWIAVNKENKVSYKQFMKYEKMHEYLKAAFPYDLLKDITKPTYQKFLNEYSATHSTDSVRKLNAAVRNVMDDAIHDGLILKNPTYKAVTVGGKKSKANNLKFLEYEQYKALKLYLEGVDTLPAHFLLLTLVTGARFSEIQQLKVSDFNFLHNKLHLPGTKTDTSDRTISLDVQTMKRMKHFIDNRPTHINGHIFSHYGTLVSNNTINGTLAAACKELKAISESKVEASGELKKFIDDLKAMNKPFKFDKVVTCHALRHTHCSVLIAEGISIHYISKRLGHKNIGVTMSVYSHLLEQSFEKEDEKAIKFLESI